MTTIISPNLRREKVLINSNGDVIDRNKNIVEKNEVEKIDIEDIKAVESKSTERYIPASNPMDIQKQIEDAEKHLESLKALKAQKITEMEEQLTYLKQG